MVTSGVVRIVGVTAALLLPLLTHLYLLLARPGHSGLWLLLAQFAILFWLVLARVKTPWRYPALGALTLGSVASAFMQISGGLVLTSALLHTLAYTSLLVIFASSMQRGREPMVSFFASTIHGPLSEALRQYTRRVTGAWCIFFALQLIISATLLLLAPITWWSLFVNVLNAPLVCLLFVVERVGRRYWISNPPKEGLTEMMAMLDLMKDRLAKRDPVRPG